jgi:hypothetical protein
MKILEILDLNFNENIRGTPQAQGYPFDQVVTQGQNK